jgi:hypothetical protein
MRIDPVWHLAGHRGERRVEIVRFAHAEGLHGHAERRRGGRVMPGSLAFHSIARLSPGTASLRISGRLEESSDAMSEIE